MQGVFQENLITDRNGRYVLPVRADHSGRLKGFVHDISASGQTLYIEPAVALESNNRVQTLVHKIAREEERILARLTASVRKIGISCQTTRRFWPGWTCAEADCPADYRPGRRGSRTGKRAVSGSAGCPPSLLVAAAMTRLAAPAVVPIDLRLPAECHSLIISGPNTGGKTVALKTAGLLVLMVRAGLPVPCAPGSRCSLSPRSWRISAMSRASNRACRPFPDICCACAISWSGRTAKPWC